MKRLAHLAILTALLIGASAPAEARTGPPSARGYFHLRPVGAWSNLPGDRLCAARVHRSRWEPRRQNAQENRSMPRARSVRRAFAARPRAVGGAYRRRWDTWLLPRVDGHHTGTTDEIFQWAACKWGMPDNLLRAIAFRESTWYQFLHFRDGSIYPEFGSGDLFSAPSPASQIYCDSLAGYGHDYQLDMGQGLCPKTFSIMGVMSWQDPSWGQWPHNQNGTFPFNRNSTAFAADYLGATLRGCYEGWETWLGDGGTGYSAGQIWGCVGAWYAGDWHSGAADEYIVRVRRAVRDHPWLSAWFRARQFECDPDKGCPV
jgi:hypothetical protein